MKIDKKALNKELRRRTAQQNKSLHLWLEWVATELNLSGQTVQMVLGKTLEVEWNKNLAKELLWRRAQKAVTGKTSTTELEKIGDIDLIFDTLNRFLGEKFKVHIPWPTQEQLEKWQEEDKNHAQSTK